MTDSFKSQIFNLSTNLKRILIIALVIILIGIGLAVYFVWIAGPEAEQLPIEKIVPKIPTPEEAGAGIVGEIKIVDEETGQEEPLITATFPPQVFSTGGTISEIKQSLLTIAGSGSNFADQTPRTLTVTISDDTLIFEANLRFQATGEDGLKYLKQGDKIVIGGQGNIRGKTEFEVAYIKKL